MNKNPWIEKYRPTSFENIVLDDINKKILNGIMEDNYFPNILFYGPPGTGKTTTIINLINKYSKIYKQENKGLVIHLNASDDRGIDIIRNQIYQFVNTKSLFNEGTKFVILDEADYMTKNAQTALRDLIQNHNSDVRYCLICNYISRIDKSLQNEFVKLHFCNLPKTEILKYLNNIIKNENIKISNTNVESIQKLFKSDIRSMVNYIQSHQNIENNDCLNIIDDKLWKEIINFILKENLKDSINYITSKCELYQYKIKDFIKQIIYCLVNKEIYVLNKNFVSFFKYIIYNHDAHEESLLNFFILRFCELHKSL